MSTPIQQIRHNPILHVILAGLLLGTAPLFIKTVSLSPHSLVFFRSLIPALYALGVLHRQQHLIPLLKQPINWIIAFTMALQSYLFYYGYTNAPASQAIVILFTWPIFFSLLAIPFLKEPFRPRLLLFTLMSFIGITLIHNPFTAHTPEQSQYLIPLTAMLIAGLLVALVFIFLKKQTQNLNLSIRQKSLYKIGVFHLGSTLIFFPKTLLDSPPLQDTLLILASSILMIIAFLLLFSGMQQLPSAQVASLTYIEPITSVLIGLCIFHEQFTSKTLLGTALILISALLASLPSRKKTN